MRYLQVLGFVLLLLNTGVAKDGPNVTPLLCIVVGADTSCQAKFGNDPGDISCSNSPCGPAMNFTCDPTDPAEETRSNNNWNTNYKEAREAGEDVGVWGRMSLFQCVASRPCECQFDLETGDWLCMMKGPETQKANKYFYFASYVTNDWCWLGQ
jgi:hypothetical protein